jgi:ABC-type phosphate transport system permease subunit
VVVFPLLLAAAVAVAIPLGLLMALVVASHSSQTLHRFLHLMIVQWT